MESRVIASALRVSSDFWHRISNFDAIPIVYFTDRPNVGDLLNEYIVPKISGKKIIKVKSSFMPHLRAIGSVVGSSSRYSYIWGSGSIDGVLPSRGIDGKKIFALRGERTRRLIESAFDLDLRDVPLGDPAVLMPRFFYPAIAKINKIGIVPHFSDEEVIRGYLKELDLNHIEIIEVGQDPETFVSKILECKYIFSSSLHGLILADSYGIPNAWIKVSDKLLGGNFKFIDYYSTTDSVASDPRVISRAHDLLAVLECPDGCCRINSYIHSLDALIESFPSKYRVNNYVG